MEFFFFLRSLCILYVYGWTLKMAEPISSGVTLVVLFINIRLYDLVLIGWSNTLKYFVTSNRVALFQRVARLIVKRVIYIRIDAVLHYYIYIYYYTLYVYILGASWDLRSVSELARITTWRAPFCFCSTLFNLPAILRDLWACQWLSIWQRCPRSYVNSSLSRLIAIDVWRVACWTKLRLAAPDARGRNTK